MNYIKYQIEVGISKYKIYEETIYLSRYGKLTNMCNRGYFDQLYDKLEKLNGDFRDNQLIFEENTIIGGFSFGVSEFPKNGVSYNELFKIADKNMYQYK